MMTRRFAGAFAVAMAASLVAVADTLPEQDKSTTLTGCVRTGSASTVYILRGAADPDRGESEPFGGGVPGGLLGRVRAEQHEPRGSRSTIASR